MTEIKEEEKKLVAYQADSGKLIQVAEKMVVNSPETEAAALKLLSGVTILLKNVEAERILRTKDLNAHIKWLNSLAKKSSVPLTKVKKISGDKILTYQAEEEEKRRKEQEKIERERQEKLERERREAQEKEDATAKEEGREPETAAVEETAPVPVIPEVPITKRTEYGTVTRKGHWTYEVVDIVELAKARPDLVIDNSPAINKLIRGKDGERDIPGLRVFQEKTLATRG